MLSPSVVSIFFCFVFLFFTYKFMIATAYKPLLWVHHSSALPELPATWSCYRKGHAAEGAWAGCCFPLCWVHVFNGPLTQTSSSLSSPLASAWPQGKRMGQLFCAGSAAEVSWRENICSWTWHSNHLAHSKNLSRKHRIMLKQIWDEPNGSASPQSDCLKQSHSSIQKHTLWRFQFPCIKYINCLCCQVFYVSKMPNSVKNAGT